MGLNIVAEKVARAEFSAVAALIASRFTNPVPVLRGLVLSFYRVMIFRQ
jgi:hypothetical protein